MAKKNALTFKTDDGGRAAAGCKGKARDCGVRALAIVTGRPYREIYDLVNEAAKTERRKRKSGAETGIHKPTMRKVAEALGLKWVPTMQIGEGCRQHLDASLPPGRLVAKVSRHYVAVIDGCIHDTHNPDRDGTRCVYGYYKA